MRSHMADYDVVVVGGGLSGVAAAIAAARLDRRVALINNRPVLGGNSSSEVRVWVCGATAHGNQRWARENGIIGELYLENQYRNPDGNPIHWDDVVLDAVRAEPNISLYLNTDVRDVVATGPEGARRIESVTGWTMGAETETRFVAPVFLDCTGDGLVGHLAGARARLGKESRGEFDEDWAPEEAERTFLGSTLLFYTKDVGHPVRFVAPASAKSILETPIPSSRIIRSGDSGAHYWWIEWGGELDIVHDNERIRDELRSVILGIWDHIKNSGEFDAENLDLEWIGNVPGKREYRRLVGDYTLHQRDVIEQTRFDDGVAFGGWSIDLHPKEGMYATGAGAVQRFSNGVFEIPFRSLYSADVENLLMAGRDISATHIAFGAARVMATCAAMGEAAGTAASLVLARRTTPRGLYENHREELRQLLLRQDAPLIGVVDADPANLSLSARVSASGVRAGLGPSDTAVARPHPLTDDVGVVVPVHPRLDGFEVRVAAEQDVDLAVEVWSTGLAQNVVPERLEHAVTVTVAAGEARWVHAPVRWEPETPANAVIVVRAQPGVTLFVTDELPPRRSDSGAHLGRRRSERAGEPRRAAGAVADEAAAGAVGPVPRSHRIGGVGTGTRGRWIPAPLRRTEPVGLGTVDRGRGVAAARLGPARRRARDRAGLRRRPRHRAEHPSPSPRSAPRDALARRHVPGRDPGGRVRGVDRGRDRGGQPSPPAQPPASSRNGRDRRRPRGRDGDPRRSGGPHRGLPCPGVTCRAIP